MPSNIVLSARLDQGSGSTCPPQHVLDRIADAKLTGGYGKRNPLCPVCFTRQSVTGHCGCEQ